MNKKVAKQKNIDVNSQLSDERGLSLIAEAASLLLEENEPVSDVLSAEELDEFNKLKSEIEKLGDKHPRKKVNYDSDYTLPLLAAEDNIDYRKEK